MEEMFGWIFDIFGGFLFWGVLLLVAYICDLIEVSDVNKSINI